MEIITAKQAAEMIQDESVLASAGFALGGVADELLYEVEQRFLATGHPANITAMAPGAQGDWGDAGMNRLAHDGLLKRLIEGFLGPCQKVSDMIVQNRIEYYNFPIGVISAMFRALAQGKEGELTKLGLHTYLDPRIEGGKSTPRTTEELVELVTVRGEEHLFYKAPKIDVAFIRGTWADENGNITFTHEPIPNETIYIAMAAKACGGKVIAQVESLAEANTLNSREVKIWGSLVDYVVICSDPQKFQRQTVEYYYNPALSGQTRIPVSSIEPLEFDYKKVICRRAAMEIKNGDVVNVGVGIPMGVNAIAVEEGMKMLFTAESGLIGGSLLGGYNFGTGMNNWCATEATTIFDYYMGGGLSITCLGLAQVNAKGDVNVARFADRMTGSGGFINISQPTKNVVFCGSLTAGGLKSEIKDGKMTILQEGKMKKFVKDEDLMQITFSSQFAKESHQNVLFVTDRCVFKLQEEGLVLTEIAPGIDIQKDILNQMDFAPVVSKDLKLMDARLFREEKMGLGDQ